MNWLVLHWSRSFPSGSGRPTPPAGIGSSGPGKGTARYTLRAAAIGRLRGCATFLRLPDIAETLETIPPDRELHVDLAGLHHIDHAVLELLAGWEQRHRAQGSGVIVDRATPGGAPAGADAGTPLAGRASATRH